MHGLSQSKRVSLGFIFSGTDALIVNFETHPMLLKILQHQVLDLDGAPTL